MSDLGRTPEGGFEHHVSDKVNDNELWDDTLYMVALFLASYGQASGRRELVDEASRQFLVHARYLADTHTGLWFHGWTFDGRHNFAESPLGARQCLDHGRHSRSLRPRRDREAGEGLPAGRSRRAGRCAAAAAGGIRRLAHAARRRHVLRRDLRDRRHRLRPAQGLPARPRHTGLARGRAEGAAGGDEQYRSRPAPCSTSPTARAWATISSSTETFQSSRPVTARPWQSCAFPKPCSMSAQKDKRHDDEDFVRGGTRGHQGLRYGATAQMRS